MRNNTMLGFTSITPFPSHLPHKLFPFSSSSSFILKPQPLISPKPHPFLVFAGNNNNTNGLRKEQQEKQEQQPSGSNGEDVNNNNNNNSSKQGRPIFSFNWNTLLDPDPDNVLALGLTGLLTWASAQVLWQLLFISLAILVAALKYSFIAALLLFILITLL